MHRQRDFSIALRSILAQGGPSVINWGTGRCVMNGAEGRHCSIGWLLDQETRHRIDTQAGGSGVCAQATQYHLPRYMVNDLEFYTELQRCHDVASFGGEADFPDEFRRQMRGLAGRWGLDYNEETEPASVR